MRRQGVLMPTMLAEMVIGNKGVAFRTQPKAKGKSHGPTIIGEAETGAIIGAGRQGGPAAVSVGVTPAHPGGSPNHVRPPAPPDPTMPEPAAIVERRPTPRVIRIPIPARIGINPTAAVKIRAPARVDHHDGGLPNPAIAFQLNPGAIGGERIVKGRIGDIGLWRRGGRSLSLRGNLRRRGRDISIHFNRLRSHCRGCKVGLQRGVALDHRRHHARRNSDVVEVNDLVGR